MAKLKRILDGIVKNNNIVATSEIMMHLDEKEGQLFSQLFDQLVESGKATYNSDVNKNIAKEILKHLY